MYDKTRVDTSSTVVIIPTYNERENIERLCGAVLAQGDGIDVLVVDDNSPDGTGDVVASMIEHEPRIHLLRRAGKLGLGTAHVAGFRWALERHYAFVITMDADLSHPPEAIPAMVEMCQECDVVIGSRYVPGGGHENWPWRRVALSRISNWVARTFLWLEPRDCTGAFRCYRRWALEEIPLENIRSKGYSFMEEMLWQCSGRQWRFGEVPIVFSDRAGGESKMSLWEVVAAVWTVVRLIFTSRRRRRRAATQTAQHGVR